MIRIEQLLEPLRELLNKLSAEQGEVNLFGFFLREGQTMWDLALSARWLEEAGWLEGFRVILAQMTPPLREKALYTFRLVTVNPDDPRLAALVKEIPVENGLIELRDVELFDMDMKRAFILQAKLPPAKASKSVKSPGKPRAAKHAAPKAMHASRAR